MVATEAGHRELPHTADEIVEAWGPTRTACLTEAVHGLVACFADVTDACPTGEHPIDLPGTADDLLLVDLLEEVVYLLDARGEVPVVANLVQPAAGGLTGTFRTAPVHAVAVAGPAPKGIAHSGLWIGRQQGQWRCRFTVDVRRAAVSPRPHAAVRSSSRARSLATDPETWPVREPTIRSRVFRSRVAARWRSRSAQSNSMERMARPATIASSPGPGVTSMTIPTATSTKPAVDTATHRDALTMIRRIVGDATGLPLDRSCLHGHRTPAPGRRALAARSWGSRPRRAVGRPRYTQLRSHHRWWTACSDIGIPVHTGKK